MIIREAIEIDFDAIAKLYADLHPDEPPATDARAIDTFRAILSDDRLILWVGFLNGEMIATCYLNLISNLTRDAAPYGVIENVVTLSEHRNQGYGQAIIKHALDHAWQFGCYKVMLQTGSRRESTHNLYKACGFDADEKFAFIAHPPGWDRV